MSTLSLDDLGPRMRQALGLDRSCGQACNTFQRGGQVVATIPVIEAVEPAVRARDHAGLPGETWLRTGLHRLRVPRPTAVSMQTTINGHRN